LVALAVNQAGYISAETMNRAYQDRIDALTDSKTKLEIYEH